MKQSIHMSDESKVMINKAMTSYRGGLKGMGQRLFDIAFNKIQEMDQVVKLDGMEMIYVTQALNFFGKKLSAEEKFVEASDYRQLAMGMEQIRVRFQLENGPKIKNKKAASAGTQTA